MGDLREKQPEQRAETREPPNGELQDWCTVEQPVVCKNDESGNDVNDKDVYGIVGDEQRVSGTNHEEIPRQIAPVDMNGTESFVAVVSECEGRSRNGNGSGDVHIG